MSELDNDDVAALGAAARILYACDMDNFRTHRVEGVDHQLLVDVTQGPLIVHREVEYVVRLALEAYRNAATWIAHANTRGDWSPRRPPWEDR